MNNYSDCNFNVYFTQLMIERDHQNKCNRPTPISLALLTFNGILREYPINSNVFALPGHSVSTTAKGCVDIGSKSLRMTLLRISITQTARKSIPSEKRNIGELVPLICSHMSRDLISYYLKLYLLFIYHSTQFTPFPL